jgi:hypothetical protein
MSEITTTRTTESDNSWTSSVFRKEQRLLWVHLQYTSNATAGNRQIRIAVTDGTNTYFDTHSGAVQTASNLYHYECFQGIFRETSFIADAINVPLPQDLVIPANFYLVVEAESGGDAGDSMIIAYQTEDVDGNS